MIEEGCKADNSLAKQTCSKFQVLIAVTWLTLAPDQGLDCVSYLDHERWGDSTTLETRFMKMQPNHLWTLQQGHLHLLWSSKLKPLQLLMKWCSWECWLIPDSGMEFQIFFHPLIVRLPFLIHAVHFCWLFTNVQDCSAIVLTEGRKMFRFEYGKGVAA